MKTATVQFCGAGGTSEAARMAGIQVVAAINHSKIAIASHKANHDHCTHYQQDITEVDPDDVVDSDLLLTLLHKSDASKWESQTSVSIRSFRREAL